MGAGAGGVVVDLSDGGVELSRWVENRLIPDDDHPGMITIDFSDRFELITGHATPTEARALAAALVRLADEIEQEDR